MPEKWFIYYRTAAPIGVKTAPVTKTGDEVDIPKDADWTDQGGVISPGGSGSWDVRLSGALSPCTLVKKGDTYFLYYIGADGNRKSDGGPRHRALGVATSSNGINFTKRGRILTYLPHNNEEEGIFSAGAFLDDNGEIVLYYSALDAGSKTSLHVDSDIRLAVSSNGLNFSDKGDVISHDDSGVAGYGDELFPVGSFREGNTFYVYYINQTWSLYLAQGSARNNINGNTQKILSASDIKSGSPQRISPIKIAISLCRSNRTEIRTAPISSPGSLSAPVESYSQRMSAIHLDAPIVVTYTCPFCEATFDSRAELDDHIGSMHPSGEWTANLLINPGAEEGWTGWALDTRGGSLRVVCGYESQHSGGSRAYKGNCRFGYFGPTAHDNAVGKAWQDADLPDKPLLEIRAGGWGRQWAETKDRTRLTIEYLNSAGGVITSYNTGWMGGDSTWREYKDQRVLPSGCRKVRVRMEWTTPRAGEHSGCFWDEMFVQYRERETFTETTIICPACGSTLRLTVSSVESKNLPMICPICGETVGIGYTVMLVSEEPWPPPPTYTKKTVTCSGCGATLELTISSDPSENVSQVCPVCGAPAD